MIFLFDVTIKVSVALLAVLLVMRLLSKQSAALRHCVLSMAIFCAAITPVASWMLPAWNIVPTMRGTRSVEIPAGAPGLTSQSAPALQSAPAARAPSAISRQLLEVIWLAGVVIGVAGLIAGLMRLARMTTSGEPVTAGPWPSLMESISGEYGMRRNIRLLRSQKPAMLVTWGVLRPTVLIPAGSDDWSEDRIRAVLLHELAHIRRFDWLIQMAAETLRAVYWFDPMLWIVCRRLRLESEYACDDAVLAQGIAGSKYAAHLLEVVRAMHQTERPWSTVLAMARVSTVERRFKAMLNPNINRNPVSYSAMLGILIIALGLTLPLAALSSSSTSQQTTGRTIQNTTGGIVQNATGRIVGTVSDNAGAKVSRATVVASTPDGRTQGTATTNADGSFVFSGLSAGPYLLQVFAVGFGPSQMTSVDLQRGQDVRRDIKMDIGFVKERAAEIPEPSRPPKRYTGEQIDVDLKNADIRDFFELIGGISGLNLIIDQSVGGTLTVRLKDMPWDQALDTVLSSLQLRGDREGNTIRISRDSPAARERFNMQFELYRNGTLIGAPRLSVLDQGKGNLIQVDKVTQKEMSLSFSPTRIANDRVAVDFDVNADGRTVRAAVVVSDNNPGVISTTLGPDSFEIRFSITANK